MSAVGPEFATCPVCANPVFIVNFHPASRNLPARGYLARHGRKGVRKGAKCRGSFGAWTGLVANQHEPLAGPPRDLVAVLPIPEGEPAVLHCPNEAEAAKTRRNMISGAAYAVGPCYCPKGKDDGA